MAKELQIAFVDWVTTLADGGFVVNDEVFGIFLAIASWAGEVDRLELLVFPGLTRFAVAPAVESGARAVVGGDSVAAIAMMFEMPLVGGRKLD